MSGIVADMPFSVMLAAAVITLFAGFVKGAVGFGMPMIMISGLGSVMPAETALAALILPTLVSNLAQALRQGWQEAWEVVRRMWLYILLMLVFLASSAQLVAVIPREVMFLAIGVPIVVFAVMQLFGVRLRLNPAFRQRDEMLLGTVAGLVGGVSGVWGPPLVAYLAAQDTEKREAVRIQGVIFAIGSVALFAAHLRSGVLNAQTLPLSVVALVPTLAGLALGVRLHERMPQATFRRAMLVVLVFAGLNLLRRGLAG